MRTLTRADRPPLQPVRASSRRLAPGDLGARSTRLILATVVGLVLLACGPKERTISGRLHLGPEWTEIKPDPPLRSSRMQQIVDIELPVRVEPPDYKLRNADGTVVEIEVEVVDDRGEVYPHRFHEIGGGWVGFSVVKEKLPKEEPPPFYLSPDRRYPTVRIRSKPAIIANAVRFICSSPK